MTKQPQQKPVLLLAVAASLVLAGAGAFLMLAPKPQGDVDAGPAVALPPVQPVRVDPRAARPTKPVAELPAPTPIGKDKPNRLARDLEREQIWSALGRKHDLKPAAPGSAAPSEAEAALLPKLDKNYVHESIEEQLVPVAVDCYNTALQRDATLGGSLVFEFTIIGDEEIGGVVEEVELGEDSTFDDEFLRECLRESLMAVTFPPPPDGGRVEVSYPMHFG